MLQVSIFSKAGISAMPDNILPDEVPESPPERTMGVFANGRLTSGMAESSTDAQASAAAQDSQEGKAPANLVADIRNLFSKTLGKAVQGETKRVKRGTEDEPGELSKKSKYSKRLEALDKDSDEDEKPDLGRLDRQDGQRLEKERDIRIEQAKLDAEKWYQEQVEKLRAQRISENREWKERKGVEEGMGGEELVLPDSMPSLNWSDSQVDNGGGQTASAAKGAEIGFFTRSFERRREEAMSKGGEGEEGQGDAIDENRQQDA